MRISDWSSDVCSSDLQYRLEGATDWTMAGEFPAISPFQQVIAPLDSLGSYDVEIAYRSDGIIGDYAVFSGVAAGAGKLATIEEGATVGAPAGMNPDGTIKEDKVDTEAILPNAISYSYYVTLTSTIPLP